MTDHMIAENAVQDVNFLHKKKELKTSSFFIPEQVQGARSASLCTIPQRLICARGGSPPLTSQMRNKLYLCKTWRVR